MPTFIPRAALRELKKLARAFFSLKPSHNPPNVELHPHNQHTQLVMRRGDAAIALRIHASSLDRSLSLPYSILDIGSRRGDAEIRIDGDAVELSWTDQNVPQRITHAVDSAPETLVVPELSPVEARLITALADATGATDAESKRYALQCIQLDGSSGTVTATDGRQLLQHQGFRFSWRAESLLVPGNRVFTTPELRRQKEVACTRDEKLLVIAAGPWRLWMPLETEARYPRVESIIPDAVDATNRVCFDAADLDFLDRNLRYLPGAKQVYSPVTVDLNGHVDVAGDRPEEGGSPMRIRLNRSTHLGSDNRLLIDRIYLQRAAKLNLKELFAFDGGRPLLCRGENVTYLWQPLHRDQAAKQADRTDEVLVESLPTVKRERSPDAA